MLQAEFSDLRERMIAETETFLTDKIGRFSYRFVPTLPVVARRSAALFREGPILRVRELDHLSAQLRSA